MPISYLRTLEMHVDNAIKQQGGNVGATRLTVSGKEMRDLIAAAREADRFRATLEGISKRHDEEIGDNCGCDACLDVDAALAAIERPKDA